MVQRAYETAQQFYDSLVEDAANGIFPSSTAEVREVFEDLLPDGITAADARLIQMAHDRTAIDYDEFTNKYRMVWRPREFVKNLNRLECFRDCKQVDPNTLPPTL